MLRMMRERESGKPGPGVRLVALLLAFLLFAASAPVLLPAVRWVLDLL